MREHAILTGSSLHEPKGAATAVSGQVYIADGLGSGTWTSISFTDLSGIATFAQLPVQEGSAVADSVAASLPDLVTDFNSLLASLRASGIIAT